LRPNLLTFCLNPFLGVEDLHQQGLIGCLLVEVIPLCILLIQWIDSLSNIRFGYVICKKDLLVFDSASVAKRERTILNWIEVWAPYAGWAVIKCHR
jgi:hypothetical protein